MKCQLLSRIAAALAKAFLVICVPLLVFSALAVAKKPTLPNFDKRLDRNAATPKAQVGADKKAALDAISTKVKEARIKLHPILGEPSFIGSTREFLTDKNGHGKAVTDAVAASIPDNDPYKPAKAFLKEHSALFGFGPEALEGAKVKKDYMTKEGNFRTIVWAQHVDDIPVFEGVFKAHWTADGQLINVSSLFVPDLVKATGKVANRKALQLAPPISVKKAIVLAAANIGDTVAESDIAERDQPSGNEKKQYFRGGKVLNDVSAHLTWLPMDGSTVQLCWDVIVVSRARGEGFDVVVDAQTGEVLVRHCLTEYLTSAQYRVFTNDSPTPMQPGWSTPLTNQPSIVPLTLVTIDALSTTASPNGWINDGDNTTFGNNVDAHLDWDNDNEPDPNSRPVGSPFRVFDFAASPSQQPSAYTNAAVVNLFYWNNWMHDQLYGYGFDEASGNFQNDNFGRGGEGEDAVQADAQDASVVDDGGYPGNPSPAVANINNANFFTPPDGEPGRMQMYLWNNGTSVPNRDADFESQTIRHEYGHGLSGRLVGGGIGISTLQAAGEGEGWSDFVSLSLGSQPTDDPNATYTYGAYLSYNLNNSGFVQNYYFGVRRYPYSTDMTKNPLTFKDIDPAQYSAHAGVPKNPLFGGVFNDDPTEVHSIGEVWCAMLWDCRARMIARYGSSGNQMMLQLVITAMKLSPENPTFNDSRDAILQADLVLYNGDNQDLLWAAFARRGLGYNAIPPISTSTSGVTEDFSLPPYLLVASITSPSELQVLASAPTVNGVSSLTTGYVRLRLYRITDGAAYDFATGAFEANWNPTNGVARATGVANWSFTLPTLPDGRYAIQAQLVNTVNSGSDWETRDFVIDGTLPTISFSPITNNEIVLDLSQLGGAINKSGTVTYRITEYNVGGTNRYWDGKNFVYTNQDLAWFQGTINGNNWTPGANVLPTRSQMRYGHYFLDAQLLDPQKQLASAQIVVIRSADDSTPPAVTIDSIATNQIITNNYLPGVYGTAIDPQTGIANVSVYLMWMNGGNFLYWTGAGWSPNPTALQPSYPAGGGQWTLNSLPSGANLPNGTYQLQVYAQNHETPPATQGTSVSFTVDYHPVFVWTEGSYTDNIYGNDNDSWDNPANWDQLSVPTADAVVVINGGSCNATMMGSMNLYALSLSNATFSTVGLFVHKLNVAGGTLNGGAVNIDGNNGVFNWSGGQLNGVYGFLAGSTVNLFGGTKTLGGGGTVLNNAGTINWTNGVIYNYAYYGSDIATINNQSNATFNIYSDGQIFAHDYNQSLFNNLAGSHFVKADGSGTNLIDNFTFNNSGDLRSSTGTLEFSGVILDLLSGGTESGSIVCDANGLLNVQGATTISNGTVSVQSATIHGDPNSSVATVNGLLEWTGGNLDGVVEIAPQSQFNLTGSQTKTFNSGAILRNRGAVYWTGTGNIYNYAYYGGEQASILNLSGAFFYAASDAQITSDYNPSYFNNFAGATFVKSSGSGTNFVSWLFNNDGLASSRSGTVAFSSGGTSSGEFSTSAGAAFRFIGGTQTLNNGVLLSGAGRIQIDGGTVTRNGTIYGGSSSPTTLDLISGLFDGTGSLGQQFTMNWTGGTVGGLLNVGSAVTVNIGGDAPKTLDSAAQMNNFGTVNWTGSGPIHNYGYSGGTQSTFVNESNAVFNLLADGTVFWQEYNRSYFTNLAGGLIAKIGGTGTNVLSAFGIENFGEIHANVGTIQFPDLLDLGAGSTVSGNATVLFSGNVNMTAPVRNSGNIIVDSGTLTGAVSTNGTALSSYSGTGTFNWTGGTMGGIFVLQNGSSIGITGSTTKTLGSAAVFDNFGTVNWSGPGTIYNYAYFGGQQAIINNHSNAVFNLLTDGTVFSHQNNESYFTNFAGGLVAKTGGTGTNFFDSFIFENSGEVQAQLGSVVFDDVMDLFPGSQLTGAGAIHFAGNVSLAGTMQGNSGAVLFDSGNFNGVVGSNATYSGTSPLTWNAGTLNGSLNIQAGSTMNITGDSDKTMGAASLLNNGGTVNWSGPGRVYNYNYYGGQLATINNMPNANFNLLTDGEVFINDYNRSIFTNQFGAHFTKVGGSGTNYVHSFWMYDAGEIRAQTGAIQFTDVLDINGGSTFTGAGNIQSAGSTTLHNGMVVDGTTFKFVGGSFTGDTATSPAISSRNGGAFEWWAGTLNGTVSVNAGAVFNLLGSSTKQFGSGAVLNNAGSITWSGGNIYNYAYYGGMQATINNLNGGLIDTAGDVALTSDYNWSTLNNYAGATFRKSSGTTTTGGWFFNNTGTIDLRTGNFVNYALTLATNSIVNLAVTTQTNSAQLIENGSLTLNGALNVSADSATLTNGLSFTLATYSSESGAFLPVALPPLPSRWQWKLTYGSTALTATIVQSTVLNPPVSLGNGQWQLNLNGEAASAAILQTSVDLNSWTSVYTNGPFNGTFDFTVTPSPGETKKFYRVLMLP